MMSVEIYPNPASRPSVPQAGFSPESRVPMRTHRTMPGYAPTDLRSCPGLADLLGVRTVMVKDESERLGLPSFKILGASWAALTTVQAAWGRAMDDVTVRREVRASIGQAQGRALVAATDGNHGRGIARVARMLGLDATILVPAGTSQSRIDAIASEGAEVLVVDGTYDDAIAASARLADDTHLVVSDTSWNGYEDAPRAVVEGYSTMFYEIDDALAERDLPQPDVLALQAGVGAFAAAGLRHYRDGRQRPPGHRGRRALERELPDGLGPPRRAHPGTRPAPVVYGGSQLRPAVRAGVAGRGRRHRRLRWDPGRIRRTGPCGRSPTRASCRASQGPRVSAGSWH